MWVSLSKCIPMIVTIIHVCFPNNNFENRLLLMYTLFLGHVFQKCYILCFKYIKHYNGLFSFIISVCVIPMGIENSLPKHIFLIKGKPRM